LGHDYRLAGAYFVTMVTVGRSMLFGRVRDDQVDLSSVGMVAHEEWLRMGALRSDVVLDEFVVMPNHIHGIVWLEPPGDVTCSLGSVIGGFKSAVSRRINQRHDRPLYGVWQRSYHDRVVRNERELEEIRGYILGNPQSWSQDPENPNHRPTWS
jgi:REP element-mobilizing transposase RayT